MNTYKPGDVVNGYVLTTDLRWVPQPGPAPWAGPAVHKELSPLALGIGGLGLLAVGVVFLLAFAPAGANGPFSQWFLAVAILAGFLAAFGAYGIVLGFIRSRR